MIVGHNGTTGGPDGRCDPPEDPPEAEPDEESPDEPPELLPELPGLVAPISIEGEEYKPPKSPGVTSTPPSCADPNGLNPTHSTTAPQTATTGT